MPDNKAQHLAKVLSHHIGEPFISQLYDCLRTEIYGLPGRTAIPAPDLLHELAKLLNKTDPKSTS